AQAQPDHQYKGPHVWVQILSLPKPTDSSDLERAGVALHWEPATVRKLEKLRASVNGEAGKAMDRFLEPLQAWARQQEEGQKAPAADPSKPDDRRPRDATPTNVLKVEIRGKLLRDGDRPYVAVVSPLALERMQDETKGWGPMKLYLVGATAEV